MPHWGAAVPGGGRNRESRESARMGCCVAEALRRMNSPAVHATRCQMRELPGRSVGQLRPDRGNSVAGLLTSVRSRFRGRFSRPQDQPTSTRIPSPLLWCRTRHRQPRTCREPPGLPRSLPSLRRDGGIPGDRRRCGHPFPETWEKHGIFERPLETFHGFLDTAFFDGPLRGVCEHGSLLLRLVDGIGWVNGAPAWLRAPPAFQYRRRLLVCQ